ncbi:multidrug efflux SMR transporter [Nocardiopsis sp. N85]|uniref:DMT family transporter n=1 Tax=Nocardiopsis sp. N85 TaxID=3029400 RepID=UPI00237F82BA|nr:multidrug efflux SMR transporter [Nocardiopsis sp. N85]MDE3721091.1 multidrug efflux SMR transporter [Nocardiopsis sp. N85]
MSGPPDWFPTAWVLLAAAAALEVVWALAMKESQGFTRLWPSVVTVGAAAVSFGLLALALRDLPVGTAYAVWVGLGASGVVLAGITMLGESASPLRIGCVLLILAGVVGLHLAEGHA